MYGVHLLNDLFGRNVLIPGTLSVCKDSVVVLAFSGDIDP